MFSTIATNYKSPQDYLAWESQQEDRHEYLDGEIMAMTGGTIPHNLITLNIATLLRGYLQEKNCLVFMADVKVKIALASCFHYPDLMITCDQRDQDAMQYIQYPCLIVEVLSPSTEGYDRGEKFRRYRQINTLIDYCLVDPNQRLVDIFSRSEPGKWELQSYTDNDIITLTSINWQGSINLFYEGIKFQIE